MVQTRAHDYSLEAIEQMLVSRMDSLARDLAPKGERRRAEWVAFNPARAHKELGCFSINLSTGKWADFSSGDKASRKFPALSLIAYLATEGRWKYEDGKDGAIGWARDWLGLSDRSASPAKAKALAAEAQRAHVLHAREEAERAEKKRRRAMAMWLEAKPLDGTDPASAYLAARGIDVNALVGGIPGALRWTAKAAYYRGPKDFITCPAMMAAMHKKGVPGGFAAVHRTYIRRCEDGVWRKAFGGESKRILGAKSGATIRLTRGESAKPLEKCPQAEWIAIAEGIENALLAALVAPAWRVLAAATLENIGNAELPPQIGGVRIIADNDKPSPDPKKPGAYEQLERVVNHLAFDRGLNVDVVRAPAGFKDFNDLWLGKRMAAFDDDDREDDEREAMNA